MSRNSKDQVRILIVDDEPNIVTALAFLFAREGYQVLKAYQGEEALKQIALHRPQIVILDVMMPGLDGFEVARRIHEEEANDHTRIIFLTAKGSANDRAQGYATGGEIYITKPFDNRELLTTVNEVAEFG